MVNAKTREDGSRTGQEREAPEWLSGGQKLAIATVLLRAARPMTPGEISLALPKGDQSNVRRAAEQMTGGGILVRHSPPPKPNGRGRPPRFAYSLAPDQAELLEAHLEREGTPPGLLREGQQLVVVTVEQDQLVGFYATVEALAAEIDIKWTAPVRGDKQQFLLAFEGEDAEAQAETLLLAFEGSGIECQRSHPGKPIKGHEFAPQVSKLLATARNAARKRVENETGWLT